MKKDFPAIIADKCNGCGRCLSVCPDHTLSLAEGRAVVSGQRCMACGHCVAACPKRAISLTGPDGLDFETIALDERWLAPGGIEAETIVRFLASRRSCRNYRQEQVAPEVLRDLIRGAITAPSGTNSQGWSFHIIRERKGVENLGESVARFYRRINRLAANPVIRLADRIFGRGALSRYRERHLATVAEGLAAWDNEGKDLLFHGAPAVILIAALPGASCPAEDAILAAANLMLTAHAMGLGSCMIGFAVEAMRRDRRIKAELGIAGDEEIHAAISLGYGKEKYSRICRRRRPAMRFI